MPNGRLTYKGAVYPWHCDHMGHMNVMWYVGKFDEATWQFFTENGLSPKMLRDEQRGMAALEQHLTYQREALPGDVLEIYTRPVEVRDKTIRFAHEMRDSATGELIATSELVAIHLDVAAREGVPLPNEVRTKLETLLTSAAESS